MLLNQSPHIEWAGWVLWLCYVDVGGCLHVFQTKSTNVGSGGYCGESRESLGNYLKRPNTITKYTSKKRQISTEW